jgi:hypothetical protein
MGGNDVMKRFRVEIYSEDKIIFTYISEHNIENIWLNLRAVCIGHHIDVSHVTGVIIIEEGKFPNAYWPHSSMAQLF